jgi:hypothetical protein
VFGRAFTELFGALLMTRAFWVVIAVLALVGWLIDNPIAFAVLGAALVVLVAAVLVPGSRRITLGGIEMPLRTIECPRCRTVGRTRLVNMRWSDNASGERVIKRRSLACLSCGYAEPFDQAPR